MGILISNNGTMTLPCVLFIVGIPLLAIGQYRFNKEGIISSSAGGDGGSGSGTTIFALLSFREKNFQWNTGIIFVVLAVLLVISETKIFNDCYFKLKMLLQGGDSSSDSATTRRTNDEDDIETEIMSTYYTHEEIVKQIKTIIKDNNKNNNIANNYKCRNLNRDDGSDVILKRNLKKIICCLNALAFKIDTIHKNKQKNKSNDNNENNDNNVFLSSQEASYIALQAFNDKDQIISSAFSLLALTAKCRSVRQRHHHHHSSSLKSSSKLLSKSSSSTPTPTSTSLESEQSDINYDLKLPIQIMKSSLERTKKGIRMKDTNNNNTTTDNTIDQKEEEKEEKEQLAAEVQRKGCIYLGALADGDTNLAGIIVQSGGLARIIESIDWFRYHLHVINWALWAIFNLCFDHMGNKLEFFRCNGTIKICCAMKNVLKLEEKDMSTGSSSDDVKCLREEDFDDDDSDEESGGILEVARHGVAILFDFLRYDSTSETNYGNNNGQPTLDFMQVRRVALNAGLHEVIILAMKRCSKNTQVMMMGNQILVATGYNGKIPSFQGSIVPVPRK
jgi:hypothetical protein